MSNAVILIIKSNKFRRVATLIWYCCGKQFKDDSSGGASQNGSRDIKPKKIFKEIQDAEWKLKNDYEKYNNVILHKLNEV